MKPAERTTIDRTVNSSARTTGRYALSLTGGLARHAVAAFLALIVFYLSLLITSAPVSDEDQRKIDRAIMLLDERGFTSEAFVLLHVTSFRSSNNWLNDLVQGESSYASTNFPFQVITLHPDFFTKTNDDTERAMVLLHEAQHLFISGEAQAYAYVWRERHRLGWTQLSHGMTPTFVTVELQTREYAPELFSCSAQLWNDCTENLRASR